MIKALTKLTALFARRNNKAFVTWLRKHGAQIGSNTTFINCLHASVDSRRLKYLNIGDNCVICSGVSLILHDYSWYVLGNEYQELYPSGGQPIEIGSNVFVGAHSLILGNTKIGDNVIIAAGSVVKGTLSSNMVYGGNPVKPIMSLDEYRERRKAKYIDDAKREVQYFQNRFGRSPDRNEMKNYAVLFNDTKEDISENTLGFARGYYKKLCKNTASPYENYDVFLETCKLNNDQ